jgi:hypothetical protein
MVYLKEGRYGHVEELSRIEIQINEDEAAEENEDGTERWVENRTKERKL